MAKEKEDMAQNAKLQALQAAMSRIEKDFGNKVKKPYSIGAGYRYTW